MENSLYLHLKRFQKEQYFVRTLFPQYVPMFYLFKYILTNLAALFIYKNILYSTKVYCKYLDEKRSDLEADLQNV